MKRNDRPDSRVAHSSARDAPTERLASGSAEKRDHVHTREREEGDPAGRDVGHGREEDEDDDPGENPASTSPVT